jgi:hypothetical protein
MQTTGTYLLNSNQKTKLQCLVTETASNGVSIKTAKIGRVLNRDVWMSRHIQRGQRVTDVIRSQLNSF